MQATADPKAAATGARAEDSAASQAVTVEVRSPCSPLCVPFANVRQATSSNPTAAGTHHSREAEDGSRRIANHFSLRILQVEKLSQYSRAFERTRMEHGSGAGKCILSFL